MNWYVKYNGTGEISGPVHQKTALSMAEQFDGMAFSEEIFSVEELLHELKGLRTSMEIMRNGEDDAIGLLCGRISNALISQELASKDIEEGLGAETCGIIRELRALSVDVILRGSDRQTCHNAADALVQLSRSEVIAPYDH